jgi:NADPH:quinone reductase-like Zn-dependent oxidoreductase
VPPALREQNGLKAGQRLVVVGASGGVGHVAVQVGKALGAHVTAICSSANAEFVASRCGADAVVDYKSDVPVEEALRSLASTARAPFDLLLDCVSSHDPRDAAAAYEPIIRSATFDAGDSAAVPLLAGKYVCIGGVTSDWLAAGLKRKTGVDLFSRGRELFWIRFPCSAGALGELAELADAGKLRPSVAEVLPFSSEGVQSAFAKLNGRRTAGKIVIQVSSDKEAGEE